MGSLQPAARRNSPRSKKSLVLSGLSVILMTGALWFVTDGFTDGSFSSLGISVIVTNVLVGILLGLLDVSLLVDERLQSLCGNHPYTRLVIGGLLGLIAAILYTFLDVQPVAALVVIVSFFAAEFAGRTYHVFAK